ncbi:MAG TPA: two-component regulator propeller domain-containing protein, partial [Tenuifilaceae bacterium]|nr:two-component regulator propeller domain-containing protein [Tenuifilaceae bacterium]
MRVLNGFVKCDLLAHLLLPLMLCSTIILQAQTIKKATDPLASFTNYNTEQGLALSSVACSFMDSQGNLWFGTYGGGASRFDGKNFVNFNNNNGLSRNTIWNIEEDIYGNIWFGTDGGGISVYDGYEFRTINSKQ